VLQTEAVAALVITHSVQPIVAQRPRRDFTYLGSRPLWANFDNNRHACRGRWCNHSVQFWFQYFKGFQICRGSKFPFPIDLAGHRYNSFAATAQPVIAQTISNAP